MKWPIKQRIGGALDIVQRLRQQWQDQDTRTAELDFMHDADRFMIEQDPLRARVLLWALAASVAIFLFWAALADIEEITHSQGKVIPSQQLQVLQSLDGGLVSALLVKEGQRVQPGQIVLQIDSTRFESSAREGRAQYLSLLAKAARLEALAENTPFIAPADVLKEDAQTANEEQRLYAAARAELDTQIAIARQQMAQRQQELSEMRVRLAQATQSYDVTAKELSVTKPLIQSGAVSEVELLRLERDVARFRGERDVANAQIARVQFAINEAARKIQEVELNFRNLARKEFSDVSAKLNALEQSSVGLNDRVKQSAIRSPVHGTVKRLLVNTVGGVVQPGRDLIEIVPLEGNLLLEARVPPKDIAFLRPGQKAMVKFTAYDFSIYGGLEATLEHIGADSVTAERGDTFYTVRVRTTQPNLGPNRPIIPGMVAEVDIMTGEKSVLSYLLKPVLRAKQTALTER